MGALAIPLISLAVQHVPELLNAILGDKAGNVAKSVLGVAQHLFGTVDAETVKEQIAADQQKLDAFKASLSALVASDQAQGAVNKAEAGSPFFFVAGWRPFIGWVCGLGLTYQFVMFPFLVWGADLGHVAHPPALDISQLLTLLTGMLGLSVVRSYDKLKGTDTKSIIPPGLSGLFGK